MQRGDVLLAVLGAAGGGSFSPVQLQKAVFLIDRNAGHLFDPESRFAFAPYDYGPFDKDVYQQAAVLELAGFAERTRAPTGYMSYQVSAEGVDKARELLESMSDVDREYIKAVVKWVKSLSFAALVKSIYQEYPEMKVNSIFTG